MKIFGYWVIFAIPNQFHMMTVKYFWQSPNLASTTTAAARSRKTKRRDVFMAGRDSTECELVDPKCLF